MRTLAFILQKISFLEIITLLLSIISPLYSTFFTLIFLIIIDLITGVIAAHKKGVEITSRRMSHSISKIVFYNFAIISAFLIENYIITHDLYLTKIVSGVIAMVEFKSILENISKILGYNIVDKIMDAIKRKNNIQ